MKRKLILLLLCVLPALLRAQSTSVSDTAGYARAKEALMMVSEKMNKGGEIVSKIALFDEMRKLLMVKFS